MHCSSKGHNLSVVKAMSVPQARDMKGTGNKLVIFCKYCNGQLVLYLSSREEHGKGERCRLSMLSDNTGNMLTILIIHGLWTKTTE